MEKKNDIWCQKNATPAEFNSAVKFYCDNMHGMPTFTVVRSLVEANRALDVKHLASEYPTDEVAWYDGDRTAADYADANPETYEG
jgi:hypothetical protein